MQYRIIQYKTIQCNTLQYELIFYGIKECRIIQYDTLPLIIYLWLFDTL